MQVKERERAINILPAKKLEDFVFEVWSCYSYYLKDGVPQWGRHMPCQLYDQILTACEPHRELVELVLKTLTDDDSCDDLFLYKRNLLESVIPGNIRETFDADYDKWLESKNGMNQIVDDSRFNPTFMINLQKRLDENPGWHNDVVLVLGGIDGTGISRN